MNTALRAAALLALSAWASLAATNAQLCLWYAAPARRWEEALPLGNGRLGAMIFGGVASEQLHLNENTLYSGEPRSRVRYEHDGVTYTREVLASHPDEIIALHLTASRPGALDFCVRLTSPHPTATTRADAGQARIGLHGQGPGFTPRRELKWVEDQGDTWKYP